MEFDKEQILIRKADLSDRLFIADLTRVSYSEYANGPGDTAWSDYEARTRTILLNDDSVVRLVAYLKDKIIGAVLYCPPYKRFLGDREIDNIYPEMRLLAVPDEFRNSGIGGKLINECERIAQEEGFESVTLHTTFLMETARLMYERRGYERYPIIDFEPSPGFVVWGYKKTLAK